MIDTANNTLVWDAVLNFPIKFKGAKYSVCEYSAFVMYMLTYMCMYVKLRLEQELNASAHSVDVSRCCVWGDIDGQLTHLSKASKSLFSISTNLATVISTH